MEELHVKVPIWSEDIEDEGVITFLAFATRVAETNGYEHQYSMSTEDLIRMCNKRGNGIVGWLRSYDEIYDNIRLGEPFNDMVTFQFRKEQPKCGRYGRNANQVSLIERPLTIQRQQMVWMYLLGCFNNNLIGTPGNEHVGLDNSFGVRAFYITREAGDYFGAGYIKKKDRMNG